MSKFDYWSNRIFMWLWVVITFGDAIIGLHKFLHGQPIMIEKSLFNVLSLDLLIVVLLAKITKKD